MKLRKIALTLVVLLAAVSLFAAEVSVTWEWAQNDADVAFYRYQMDSESPEGWTVVPADVTAYTAEGLDGSVGYTLYLQQSYDGIYWSVSAAAVSEPVVPAASEFVEPVIVEETAPAAVVEAPVEEVVVEEPVAVVEAPVEVAPLAPVAEEAVKKPSYFQFTTDLGLGVGYGFTDVKNSVNAALSFDFENIVKAGAVGFDIRTDIGFDVFNSLPFKTYFTEPSNIFKAESYNWSVYGDLELGLNATFGKFMIYGAGGVRLQANLLGYDTVGSFYTMNDNLSLKWGVTADLGMRFNLNKVFGIGVEESYTYLFDDQGKHNLDTRLIMSLTF